MSSVLKFSSILDSMLHDGGSSRVQMVTGLPVLDQFTSGCGAGSLAVIGGRPCMGKTVLAYQIAYETACRDQPVLILSPMRTPTESGRFMASILAGAKIELSPDGLVKSGLEAVEAVNTQIPLYFADTSRLDVAGLLRAVRETSTKRPRMIVIDDYHHFRHPYTAASQDAMISLPHLLKEVAQCLETIVVLTYALPRAVEEREDQRPILDDLSGSDPLRDVADLVLLIYREVIYSQAANYSETVISVAKNRYGRAEACGLHYEGFPGRFTEA